MFKHHPHLILHPLGNPVIHNYSPELCLNTIACKITKKVFTRFYNKMALGTIPVEHIFSFTELPETQHATYI